MSTNVWLEQVSLHFVGPRFNVRFPFLQSWIDPKLSWHPSNYDGVEMIHVPAEQIWQPDIVLFNK